MGFFASTSTISLHVGSFWALLVLLGGRLGPLLGHLGAILGLSWAVLGDFEPILVYVGASLGAQNCDFARGVLEKREDDDVNSMSV